MYLEREIEIYFKELDDAVVRASKSKTCRAADWRPKRELMLLSSQKAVWGHNSFFLGHLCLFL